MRSCVFRALAHGGKLVRMDSVVTATPPEQSRNLSRHDWVEMRLTEMFMRDTLPTLRGSIVVTFCVVAVLWSSIPAWQLWLWASALLLVTFVRYRIVRAYNHDFSGVSGQALSNFLKRQEWTWPASAALWGASMLLYFLRASVFEQLVCTLVLVGVSTMSVYTFSARLRYFLWFIDTLSLTILAAMCYRRVLEPGLTSVLENFGLGLLMVVFWALVRSAGKRFNSVQRFNLDLQFDNMTLINSLTEQRGAALEAVEIKNRFISSAAHDLRQPVHALGLYATWLAAEPHFAPQLAPQIVRSTSAINELFNSLFDFAGLDAKALRVNLQYVDMVELIADLRLQYMPVALERNLLLRTRAAPAQVWSDPVLLKRLLGNLVSNALKNTPSGGVLLAIRRRKKGWCIEVWDTGVGVAPEHQQAIFKEFYRVPQTGTEEGFGLGLAIVSRLSKELGHTVGMRSRVRRGSVFWVDINDRPIAAAIGHFNDPADVCQSNTGARS